MGNSLFSASGRVVIIGAGNVGSSIAYSLVTQEIASEIVLMDIAEDLAKAQVLDLQDAASFTRGVQVSYGVYSDLRDGDIIVITCGIAQKEGQTRLELLGINAGIIRSVLGQIKATGKQVSICMVTNPVDVLTYIAIKESGLPAGRVFGSGTYLDTARLRIELGRMLNVHGYNIHAYILGEHGDSSLPVISNAHVSGIPLVNLLKSADPDRLEKYAANGVTAENLAEQVRDKAYQIIKGKKATYYGIGSAVAKICNIMINNGNRMLPLSYNPGGLYGLNDLAISIPVKLDRHGVSIIGEVQLSESEEDLLRKSAEVIKANIAAANAN